MKWLLDRLPDEWGFRLIVAICFLSAFAIMAESAHRVNLPVIEPQRGSHCIVP